MKRIIKVSLITFLSLFIIFAVLFTTYLIITKDAVLDAEKLIGAGQKILIYDDSENEIISTSLEARKESVFVKDLSKDTINAFIASEDRTFYTHKGLNFKRMIKALFTNIGAGSFKQGASTISQQLIKNTHLSSDKTIKRKLNEIRLTKQLERSYSKDEILEMYLNTIYFGHSCYGLQSASQFYFDKKAEQLNLTESATIVGLLTSPNNYSPFKDSEKCLSRRNIVLKNMLDCNFISEENYENAKTLPLNVVKITKNKDYSDYVNAVFEELQDVNLNYYTLADGYIIKTYMDTAAQQLIESLDYTCDNSVIITDNQSGGVRAYKSTINGAKRQPGSTIKPILVYAPAIEEKNVSPFTRILDEKIDFNGYSPENYDKKYRGLVTVADSIKLSLNIPAVKTLNSVTIKKCEKYLAAMDVKLVDDEKNLSLALGGMKYGLSLKEIADKYSTFPNGGHYRPSRFIKEIVSNDGKVIYKNETISNSVYSTGTCSLMNEMLIETSKSGTAKKLKTFEYDIASKTGTCGNENGNTDAYAISYTSENCIAVWLGDKDNKRLNITGGNDCCKIMKSLLTNLYKSHTPAKLDIESGTTTINIDREEYSDNDKIIIADPLCPKLNIMTAKVLKGNEPKYVSNRFTIPTISSPSISVSKEGVNIELCHAKYYSFIVKREKNGVFNTIYNGEWKQNILDNPEEGIYIYSVTPYYEYENKKYIGKEILLPAVNFSKKGDDPQVRIPDIANKNWFNQ